ncbi:histone acetyltransferase 1 [Allomyces javanicus]|nr:histone acetyltransferase 1 [Allomyces javanicus]
MDMDDVPAPPAAAKNVDHCGHVEDATDAARPPRLDLCHAMTLWLVIGHDSMVEPPLPISFHPTGTAAVHDDGQFWQQLRDEHHGSAVPPGKHGENMVHDGHVYELYTVLVFFYPGFRPFFERAKFLARHFFDRDSASDLAGLDETDERWNFLLLYRQPPPRRVHLLVLPPFQRQGLASLLYSKFMSLNAASAHALKVTAEATTPAFDDLRDIADLTAILSRADPNAPQQIHVPEVELLPLAEGDPYAHVARDWVRGLQLEWKLEPRQAARVWEMAVLAALRDAKVPVPHEFRTLIKQRLFREGKADWVDVPRRERVEMLHRRYVAVMERHSHFERERITLVFTRLRVVLDNPRPAFNTPSSHIGNLLGHSVQVVDLAQFDHKFVHIGPPLSETLPEVY